jgi:hypothetical protein
MELYIWIQSLKWLTVHGTINMDSKFEMADRSWKYILWIQSLKWLRDHGIVYMDSKSEMADRSWNYIYGFKGLNG